MAGSLERPAAALAPLIIIALVITAKPSSAALDPSQSVIVDWFNAAQQVVRSYNIPNQLGARLYGLLGVSVYKALEAQRGLRNRAGEKMNETVVAAVAAHSLLTAEFPQRYNIHDMILASQLPGIDDASLSDAKDVALPAVNAVLRGRVGDGYAVWSNFKPASADPANAGKYQFTPNQKFALYPQLSSTLPLVIRPRDVSKISDAFQPDPLGSDEYYEDLLHTRDVGSNDSTVRTSPYDQATPAFWADGDGTSGVGGHLLNVSYMALPADTPLYEQAVFFARLGAAMWDASITVFHNKYTVLHWRPVTALRQGDSYKRYTPLPDWTPLLNTPPHPSYPSGHQATSGAGYEVLRSWLGTDKVSVTIGSEGAPLQPARTYPSLLDLVKEIGESRVLGGVHVRKESDDGLDLGIAVAKQVVKKVSNNRR